VFDMRARSACFTLFALAVTATIFAQATQPQGQARERQGGGGAASPAYDTPRPIELRESVWLEELTWMEARDLLKAGTTTIIIPTGGVEQNGPYLAAGKHNYVLQATCPAIARKLGKTLCAPIVPFVPEGDIDPPTGMMRYPSTISLSEGTYRALLTEIASSLKQHGFEHIILIGDSGGNQEGMKTVAAELSAKWAGSKTTVHFIPEYYDYPGAYKWADETFGWQEKVEGIHDDPTISSIMMTVDPNHVRIREREAKGLASINTVSLLPVERAVEAGKKIVEYRADLTVAAIRKALGASPTQ
jgi:creatinine amidohydrolase/Fe(II)-dependent formamide hydrolase-like protein